MKAFRFRLEGLLRARKVEEDRCLQALRVHQSALAGVTERKLQLEDERERTLNSLRGIETGELEMEDLMRHRRYLVALDNRSREVESEIIRLRHEMRGAQARAETAVRERQLVERLRERRKEEHDVEQRRREVREFDEIASGAYARSSADRHPEIGIGNAQERRTSGSGGVTK